MRNKVRKCLTTAMCFLLLSAICIASLTKQSYAQMGIVIKQSIESSQSTTEWTSEEAAAYEQQMLEKNYMFIAPAGFSDNIMSISSLESSPAETYMTSVNPFETPKEWKQMTVEQRLLVSEVPKGRTVALLTGELVMFVMNYNFLGDLFVYDNIQDGFNQIRAQYLGLDTLLRRSDVAICLLQLYQSIDLNDLYQDDRFSFIRMTFLETLLAQKEVICSLSEENAKELIVECINKAMEMYENPSHYGVGSTLYLGLRCLYEHDDYAMQLIDGCTELKKFVQTSELNLNEVDNETIGKLANYIQDKYLGGVQ